MATDIAVRVLASMLFFFFFCLFAEGEMEREKLRVVERKVECQPEG